MAQRYHRRADPRAGYVRFCTAGEDLTHLTFGTCALPPEGEWALESGRDEVLAVVLTGQVSASAGGVRADRLGGRASVFAGRASAFYAPPDSRLHLRAGGEGALVALCQADAAGRTTPPPYAIRPEEVRVQERGRPGFRREVHDILDAGRPAARILAGETFNAVGEWSSYPPHKHDENRGEDEVRLEEVYYFQFAPSEGFGAQFLYTAGGDLNEAYRVGHGDVTLLPRGYHPVAAAPGYRCYYLWVLAGDGRVLRPSDDPAHAWVKAEPTPR